MQMLVYTDNRSGDPTDEQLLLRTFAGENPNQSREVCVMLNMIRRFSRLLAVGAVCMMPPLLASCFNSSNGSIRGVFEGQGNPVTRVGGVPSAGEITISSKNATYRVTARRNGMFAINVPPGHYQITARDPGQMSGISSCKDSVVVNSDRITRTVVTCTFH
jgi:hypothetical protein